MALKDVATGLKSLLDHVEELVARDQAVAAPVDHLAAAIATAGLGPVAGGLVVSLFNEIVRQGTALEAEQAKPAAPTPAADAGPAAAPADAPAEPAPAGIPDAPVIGGTAG